MLNRIFAGDIVRIRANLQEDNTRHVPLSYAGQVVTVGNVYYPEWDDHSYTFLNTDIAEVLTRVARHPALGVYDEVVLISDKTKLSHWTTEQYAKYAGATVTIQVLRTDLSFYIIDYGLSSGGTFKLEDIETILPREDGFVPTRPYKPVVNDQVLLVGEEYRVSGSVVPQGWSSASARYVGAVVTIHQVASSSFRISGDPYQNNFPLTAILRKATPEDLVAWEKIKVEREAKRQALLASISVDPAKIKEMAVSVFGEDKVMVTGSRGDFSLYVHFPEIEITNSLKQQHTIRDLFVKIRLNGVGQDSGNSYLCACNISGARTTWTEAELNSGYTHSHLPNGVYMPGSEQGFCLGSSEFRIIMENIKLYCQDEHWWMMLLSLKNYVSWESIEGGPHCNIREITRVRNNRSTIVSDATLLSELIRIMPTLPLEVWEYTPKGFIINPDNPDVMEFFDTNSKIRQLVIVSSSEYSG